MRIKVQDLKFFERKTNEACPLARPKPEQYDLIGKSDYEAPSGSLGRPISMDKLLVLQSKQFNVVLPNQDDLI